MIIKSEKVNRSSGVKAITGLTYFILLFCGGVLPVYYLFKSDSIAPSLVNAILVWLFIFPILIPVYFYNPKRVILTDDSVVVKQGRGELVLPINEIGDVELFEKDLPGIRTFGSGGFLGYLGKFYSKKLGHYTAYVGDCSKSFFVTMKNGKKYLLSCDNHRGMVERINGMLI